MENKKNKTLAIVLGIFALVIVTTTASFAFFTYSRTGTTTSTIISGDIEFSFIEGTSATLANAFPVSDSVGAVDTTGEYSFDVKLTSSSNSNKMNYNVLLVDNNDETDTDYFNNEQIKFSLVKNNTYVADTSATTGVKLSDIDGFDELSNQGEGIVLQDQEITAGTTDNYKLRIWISDDVNYSNTQNGQDEQESIGKYNSYKYSLKVKVTSGLETSTTIGKINNVGRNITVELNDYNGLLAYAITNSDTTPLDSEWIEITNENAKSNVVRTASGLVKNKTITYKVGNYKTYYLHVKNILNEVSSKEFKVAKGADYIDESGANKPSISSGMIPVMYDGTNWVKVDTTEKWYEYDKQWWANVVTVSEESRTRYLDADFETPINMADINTMWVWIPRYEYETITSTTATEIKVNFLSGTTSNKTSNYITHPAFTFGSDSLEGIWVAKFEASSDTICTATSGDIDKGCDLTTLKVNIKPNVISWRGIRVSTLDLNTRAMNDSGNIYGFIESEVDTHAMKTIEWGAVAYLSQSKYGKYGNSSFADDNKEIYQNKSSEYTTGMSNGTPSSSTTNTQVTYDVEGTGTGASTTGNIYGVYDMSGGSWEYMMGVIKDNSSNNPMSGESTAYNSGFTGILYDLGNYTSYSGRAWPESRYYNLYDFGTTEKDDAAYARAKTGDGTTETKGWYGDYASFIYDYRPWSINGGHFSHGNFAGIFGFYRAAGHAGVDYTFRPVLVQK